MPANDGPALVLVTRADHPPGVPSVTVSCSLCGEDCWLSHKTGSSTVGLARTLGGGAQPLIVCEVCLEKIVALRNGPVP